MNMNIRACLLIAVLVSFFIVACQEVDLDGAPTTENNVTNSSTGGKGDIYGEDDRREPWSSDAHPAGLAALSRTAMLINDGFITDNEDGTYTLSKITMGDRLGRELGGEMCESEPNIDQIAPGYCSGFLIAPDLLATAGHCVDIGFVRCESTKVVFGFAAKSENEPADSIVPAENVYSCERVVGQVFDIGEQTEEERANKDYWYDWAVLKLDRHVEGGIPLVVTEGLPKVGDEVIAVGHPSGVSSKITPGVVVDTSKSKFFNTNLDIYVGNSGSVALNTDSEVLGVVSRGTGGQSFVKTDDGCFASHVCEEVTKDRECIGNHVIRAQSFLPFAEAGLTWMIETLPGSDEEIPYGPTGLVLEANVIEERPVDVVTISLDGRHQKPGEMVVTVEHNGQVAELLTAPRVWERGDFVMNRSTNAFQGQDSSGTWTVRVRDTGNNLDVGFIESWTLILGVH